MEIKKMETHDELIARLYPANERTCINCGVSNKAGEYFIMQKGWGVGYLCKPCEKAEDKKAERAQTALYVSGEDTPYGTYEITCPWCGHEARDSGDEDDNDDERECEECSKIFSYQRDVTVTYSSERVNDDAND